MASSKKNEHPIHLQSNHIALLRSAGMVKSNQDGKDMVNMDDQTRPSINSIYSFTIPMDVLPNNAISFGDCLKFVSSQSSARGTGMFTCDDEAQNNMKSATARLLTLLTATLCDDTIGSKPHLDYYAEVTQNANAAVVSNTESTKTVSTGSSDGKKSGSDKKSESSTDADGEKSKEKSDKSTSADSSSSSSSDSSSSSSDSDSDDDKDSSSDSSSDSDKDKEGDKSKAPAKGKKTEDAVPKTIAISRKRHKNATDIEYDRMTQECSVLATKKDIRGLLQQPQYLFFTYNGKKYPKFRIFVEELEGHSCMPEKHIPVTNRVELPRTHDRVTELLQTSMEKNASEPRIGNGYLVGLRVWIFVLDPGIRLYDRIKYFIKEQDKRNMAANLIPHPNPLYVAPLNDIYNESFYNTHVLFPYVTYGSYFRHIASDPVVKSVTKSRNGQDYVNKVQTHSATSAFNREMDKIARAEMKKKQENHYKTQDQKDHTQVGRNVSPSAVSKEGFSPEIYGRYIPGLSNSGFITNMGCVCDTQREPGNYFNMVGRSQVSKPSSKKSHKSKNSKSSSSTLSAIQKEIAGEEDGMEVDTDTQDDSVKMPKIADIDDVVDPSEVNYDLTKSLTTANDSVPEIDLTNKPPSQSLDDESTNNDESEDVQEDLFETQKEIRIARQVNENSYMLNNQKFVYGCKDATEQENRARKIFEDLAEIPPSAFKGFPCEHLVTEYRATYFGASFVNALFPHIMRSVEDEPMQKILALSSQKQYKQQVLKTARFSQRISAVASQSGRDIDAIDVVNIGEPGTESVGHSSSSSSTQLTTSHIYEDKLLKYCLNIHSDRIPTKRVIRINDADLDYKSRTTDQMKKSLLKAVAQINENESGNTPHEAILLYTCESSLNLQTSRELDLLTKGTRETALVEIARNQLTASELEIFASKNDLVMLRLRFCVEATNISAKYPKSDRFYRKAMRELRRRQTNDFVHTLQHSQKLPKSVRVALQWYMTMAAKKRQFASIPMVYKQFSVFGNYFQYIRGVLSEVMLGRNNVELFFMMYFVYITSLCYTYYLRPHFLASGPPTASKSFNKNAVGQLSVPGTFQNISHTTSMHLLQEDDYYYITHAFDEAPDLFAANKGKGGGPNSESAGGGSRLMKEWTASSKATTRSFYFDRESKGKPRRRVDEMLTALQITLICLCNQETLPPDAPLMQRFLFYVQPKRTNNKAYEATKEESSKTSVTLLDLNNYIPTDTKVYSRPADLKRMCYANNDYQNPLDGDHTETCQLIACYVLLFECMVTAAVVEDVSVDLAERWLPEIFDRFTASVGDKDVNPRNMMQSALVSRGMAVTDTIVTVLFTDILYPDLKQEKTVVVTQDSNLEPVEVFEKATSLNISKFRRYCRRHAYVNLEHVAVTATMFEHFICNPYSIPIFNTALELAHWPHSITLNNFRSGAKNDESTHLSKAFKNSNIYGLIATYIDARYACLTEHTNSLILRSIHSKHTECAEEIAFNDVQRTMSSQSRIFFNAHACMIMTSNWKSHLGNEPVNEEPTGESSKNSKKPGAPKRHRSKAEKDNNKAAKAPGDKDEDDSNGNRSMDESMDEERDDVNIHTSSRGTTDLPTYKLGVSDKKDRIYLSVDSDPTKKIPIPDTITDLQKWYAMAFDSYQSFLEALSIPEKREIYGILDYKVLKNGNEVWLKISDKIIPCERIPVVRFETEALTSKRRMSFLIEYTENGQQKTMKNAIEMTFASNSIPKSGVIFQSIKPYQHINLFTKKYEYSSYLTDIIQIPHIPDNSLYCLNPIPSQAGGRRHLDCKSISLGGLQGEHSPYTRAERHFAKISKRISTMSSIEAIQNVTSQEQHGKNDDENDDDNFSDSDSDDDEDTPYKEYRSYLPKAKKINPYILDAQIRDMIRNATGITFSNINLNEYAQLRHWFRCGINPTTPILVKRPMDDEDKVFFEQIPKYVAYSTQFINHLLYTINSKLEKSTDHSQSICSNYAQLWLEECTSNNSRENRRESTCTHMRDIFSEIYKGTKVEEKTKDFVVKADGGKDMHLNISSMASNTNVESYTRRVFGDSDVFTTPIIGQNTLDRIKQQMERNKNGVITKAALQKQAAKTSACSGQEDSNKQTSDVLCVGNFKTPEKNKNTTKQQQATTTPVQPNVSAPNFFGPQSNFASPGYTPQPTLPKTVQMHSGTPITPRSIPPSSLFPKLVTGKRSITALASDIETPPAKIQKTGDDSTSSLFDVVSAAKHNSLFSQEQ